MQARDAKEIAKIVSPYIENAIQFYDSFKSMPRLAAPTALYYCYLNLATAAVLIYKPHNWHSYRHHGVKDKSSSFDTIDLSSRVVSVGHSGTVPLLNSIVSDCTFPKSAMSIRSIVANLSFISQELGDLFNARIHHIQVSDMITVEGNHNLSTFTFNWSDKLDCKDSTIISHIKKAMPALSTNYYCKYKNHSLHCISKQRWSKKSGRGALKFHRLQGIKFINYGGHRQVPLTPNNHYYWCRANHCSLYPTLTCAMLFSFFMSSLSRYRAALLSQLYDSPLGVLADAYFAESPHMVLAVFCDLLHKTEYRITSDLSH